MGTKEERNDADLTERLEHATLDFAVREGLLEAKAKILELGCDKDIHFTMEGKHDDKMHNMFRASLEAPQMFDASIAKGKQAAEIEKSTVSNIMSKPEKVMGYKGKADSENAPEECGVKLGSENAPPVPAPEITVKWTGVLSENSKEKVRSDHITNLCHGLGLCEQGVYPEVYPYKAFLGHLDRYFTVRSTENTALGLGIDSSGRGGKTDHYITGIFHADKKMLLFFDPLVLFNAVGHDGVKQDEILKLLPGWTVHTVSIKIQFDAYQCGIWCVVMLEYASLYFKMSKETREDFRWVFLSLLSSALSISHSHFISTLTERSLLEG